MRIIAGRFGGRVLASFDAPHIRPTTDRVKGSLFNRLMGKLEGARVLDLFAGTGSLAFEALSRGARQVDLVENHRKSIEIIEKNRQQLGIKEGFTLHRRDVFSFLKNYSGQPYDLIFIDPPFTEKLADSTLGALDSSQCVGAHTTIAIESSKHETVQERYSSITQVTQKSFGDKLLSFYQQGEERLKEHPSHRPKGDPTPITGIKIAVYPGSFDPLTLGHLDIIQRISPLFEKFIVLITLSAHKKYLFDLNERQIMIRECTAHLPNVEVAVHDGLTTEFCSRNNARILVRGLRAVSDFDPEMVMANVNRKLDSSIETFLVYSGAEYSFISSTLVKEVALHQGNLSSMVPTAVKAALEQKFSKSKGQKQ